MNMKYLIMIISISAFFAASPILAGKMPLSIIYPGEGIGSIRFGDKMEKVIKMLEWGEPEELRKDANTKEYYFIYEKIGVVFVFKEGKDVKQPGDAILSRIIVTSPAFMTAGSGIRVGDRYDTAGPSFAQQNLPSYINECKPNEKDNTIDYICKGIKFSVNKKTGIVESIEVLKPIIQK